LYTDSLKMAGGKKKTDLGNKQKQGATKKIVEDKTFGLKNKNKSKKVQMYVKQVVKATEASFIDPKKQKEMDAAKKAKADKKKFKDETNALFQQVISQPKVPFGVDPKTVACAFFKAGQCKKRGDTCKFSHDQEICFGKKKAIGNKIDLTVDVEAMKAKKNEEDVAITDPVELAKAIEKKAKQMACETHIVCKHFLVAIEAKKYGWFWECPANTNGQVCKYRHALPPGYVFKDKKKSGDDDDDEEDKQTMEEKLDEMRRGVGPGAMVTAETFTEWKRKRDEAKSATDAAAEAKAQKTYKKGAKTTLTGRQLFEFDSSIFVDDEEAGDASSYVREFEDAAAAEAAKNGIVMGNATAVEPALEDPLDEAFEAQVAAGLVGEGGIDLPEGIEENLFLDEDLDDLPSDED